MQLEIQGQPSDRDIADYVRCGEHPEDFEINSSFHGRFPIAPCKYVFRTHFFLPSDNPSSRGSEANTSRITSFLDLLNLYFNPIHIFFENQGYELVEGVHRQIRSRWQIESLLATSFKTFELNVLLTDEILGPGSDINPSLEIVTDDYIISRNPWVIYSAPLDLVSHDFLRHMGSFLGLMPTELAEKLDAQGLADHLSRCESHTASRAPGRFECPRGADNFGSWMNNSYTSGDGVEDTPADASRVDPESGRKMPMDGFFPDTTNIMSYYRVEDLRELHFTPGQGRRIAREISTNTSLHSLLKTAETLDLGRFSPAGSLGDLPAIHLTSTLARFSTSHLPIGSFYIYGKTGCVHREVNLAEGPGSEDNRLFRIAEKHLYLSNTSRESEISDFDFSNVSLRISLEYGLDRARVERNFYIRIQQEQNPDLEISPDFNLCPGYVEATAIPGAVIGFFSGYDGPLDSSDPSSPYTLVNGDGDTHNRLFEIVENGLIFSLSSPIQSLVPLIPSDLRIRVERRQDRGTQITQMFRLHLLGVQPKPSPVTLEPGSIFQGISKTTAVGFLDVAGSPSRYFNHFRLIDHSRYPSNANYSIWDDNLLVVHQTPPDELGVSPDMTDTIRVLAIGESGGKREEELEINIRAGSAKETQGELFLYLGRASVPEGSHRNRIIAYLGSIDQGRNGFTYELSRQDADIHNHLFSVEGNKLVFSGTLDYENPVHENHLHVGLRASNGSHERTQSFSLPVTNVNDAPEELNLRGRTLYLRLSQPLSHVGFLEARDPENDILRFHLVHGEGSVHNHFYRIEENRLLFADLGLPFPEKQIIRVGVTDEHGLTTEGIFTISTQDLSVNIFPTETEGHITVVITRGLDFEGHFEMYAISGKRVQLMADRSVYGDIYNFDISISHLLPGIYLLVIREGEEVTKSQRIIKK